jgi:hypothetical protein
MRPEYGFFWHAKNTSARHFRRDAFSISAIPRDSRDDLTNVPLGTLAFRSFGPPCAAPGLRREAQSVTDSVPLVAIYAIAG